MLKDHEEQGKNIVIGNNSPNQWMSFFGGGTRVWDIKEGEEALVWYPSFDFFLTCVIL